MPLKYWKAWYIDHLSSNPDPVFDHPLCKKMFPNGKSKPSQTQIWTVPMCPVTGYQGEEISTSFSTPLSQEVVESKEFTPQSPFLQTSDFSTSVLQTLI